MNRTNKSIMEKNTISIAVYTESFSDLPQEIDYFKKADFFSEFNINYLPILNDNIKLDVIQGKYKHIREQNIIHSVVEFENCSGVIGTHQRLGNEEFDELTDRNLDILSEKRILEGNIYAVPFDFVVVSDEWKKQNPVFSNYVVNFTKIKEFIRLYMVNNQKFFVCPNYKIDEFFYYLYRHKQMFKNFQYFWSSNISNLCEYDDALDNRLLQFSICLDKVKSILWMKQNNITAMYLKYHMSYLMLLTTGTFDNLAWIINNNYHLNLHKKSRMIIDLKKDRFIKEVEKKSPVIAQFIKDEAVSNKITAIRELRDCIVHRDFIHTISYGDSKKNNILYLQVDDELKSKLINAGFSQSNFPISSDLFICADIDEFIDFVVNSLIFITDGVLEIINNELFEGNRQIVIWEMFEFPCEPYVL